jgi:signal transduction histidine kinase
MPIDPFPAAVESSLDMQRLSAENKRLEEELRKAKARFDEINEQEATFVATVSHEFKNILTIVREAMTQVREGLMGGVNPAQQDMLDLAKRNIDRLVRLVRNLLDVSKLEAGKMDLRKSPIDFPALLTEILQTFQTEMSKRGIRLETRIAAGPPVACDRDRIAEVLVNLLANAVKYAPGGLIRIAMGQNGDGLRLEIEDSGPGIARDDLETIFDKYHRLHAGEQEGTGLGLYVSKAIVELHGGRIWAESEPGRGSRFIFTLPATRS